MIKRKTTLFFWIILKNKDIIPNSFVSDKELLLKFFQFVKRSSSPDINIRDRDQWNYQNHDHFPLRTGTPIAMVSEKELPSPSKFGNKKNHKPGSIYEVFIFSYRKTPYPVPP